MKTNETSKIICNHCNKEKEGIQTGICNHCGKFGKSDLQLAFEWWNKLHYFAPNGKYHLIQKYIGEKSPKELSNQEILDIWIEEFKFVLHKGETVDESYPIEFQERYLPNKQFTSFDKNKFEAHANKFSQEDKLKMLQWLATDLIVLSLIDKSLRP